MSVEPNQSMEDQLRTHAERRRLEAPAFELDGAARRRLQEEVGRVYRAEAAPSTAGSGWFWTRLALVGTATAAALFLSVQLLERQLPLFPGQSTATDLELAALDDSAEAREQPGGEVDSASLTSTSIDSVLSAESFSMPIVPSGADSAPGAEQPRVRSDGGATPQAARRTAAPTPTASPDAGAQKQAAESASMRPAPVPTRAEAEGTSMSLPASGMASAGDQAAAEPVRLGQQFQQVQSYRRNPNSPAPPRVLQSFQWIREGDVVRIIDEDGSVYTGAMDGSVNRTANDRYAVSTSLNQAGRGAAQPAELRQLAVEGAAGGERFQVTGTNRTLNVPIQFEGVLIRQSGTAQTITNTVRPEPSAVSQVSAQIQGQALLGSSTRLGIVANARGE